MRGAAVYVAKGPRAARRVATCLSRCGWPAWSRDGTRLAWIDGGVVTIGPLAGGRTRYIGSDALEQRPGWSRDGSRVFYAGVAYLS